MEKRSFLASGGCQPTGTSRFLPFMDVEPQWTGKLTHAARQGEKLGFPI